MRFLSFIKNDEIVSQIPTSLTDEEAIDLDEMLRSLGKLTDDEELAITID